MQRTGSLVAALALAAVLNAQQPLYSVRSPAAAQLGHSLCVPGDLDGDLHDDIAMGHASLDRVLVHSGRTGQFLFSLDGPVGDNYGFSMDAAGDVDGDGIGDLVIGAPQFQLPAPGYVEVISGRTGALHFRVPAPRGKSNFGQVVAGAGDFNGDGFDDILIANGTFEPAWWVYSGRDGQQLVEKEVSLQVRSLAGMDDLDRDGFGDIAVSFFSNLDVEIWSGRSREQLQTYPAPANVTIHGTAMASGDVDGDGLLDVVIGTPGSRLGAPGQVVVYDSFSPTVLMRYDGTSLERAGVSVATADVNGDGDDEVLIGAPDHDNGTGYVVVTQYVGTTTATPISFFVGQFAGDAFGARVATGDLVSNGKPDFVFAAPKASEVSNLGGRVTAFPNVRPHDPGVVRSYGAGCDDSLFRRMRAGVTGLPVIGNNIDLTVRAAPFFAFAFAALGLERSADPLSAIGMPGCTLLVDVLGTELVTTDASGRQSLPFAIPNNGAFAGLHLRVQWFALDAVANQLGMVSSGGIEIRLGSG